MKKALFILFSICLIFSCDNSTNPTPPKTNIEIWQSHSTGNYNYYFRNSCFCFGAFIGPFHIFIKNNAIDSVFNFYDSSVVVDSLYDNMKIKTIEQYFTWIDSQLASQPFRDTIFYNPILGYPQYAYFDYNQMLADEEYGFIIDSLIIIK